MNPQIGWLRALLPESILVVGALASLGVDLLAPRKTPAPVRLRGATTVALIALVGAVIGTFVAGLPGQVAGDALTLDAITLSARLGVLLLSALCLSLASGDRRIRNPGEFVALVLFATAGFSLMAAAGQLIVAFVAVELASLCLYVLVGMDKTSPASSEAGLKYFLTGAMSAAFLLFGFSLIYGLTGSIELQGISRAIGAQGPVPSPLLTVALVMILVGFGFKAAAVPFHLWAPDVYEGAPLPAASLVASASKLAGFVLFTRLLWPVLGNAAGDRMSASLAPGWMPVVALMAAASLLVGNLGALAQSNVRRLLAYSAIAHAGVLLLGVLVAGISQEGAAPLLYYVITYGLATMGAFGVISVVDREGGGCRSLGDLAGLSRRSPLLAGCLMIFVLSLAGIPPLAGFFGKLFVFTAALEVNGLSGAAGWLAVLAILMSAVALYYYLLILKQAFVSEDRPEAPPIRTDPEAVFALLTAALLLVVLGLFPNALLNLFLV